MATIDHPTASLSIRGDIRWAAERRQPITLTADEVAKLDVEIDTTIAALEERWNQETHAS